MIQVLKKIQIENGTAPYTYNWGSDSTCVTFSDLSGTTDNIVETILNFQDEDCLLNSSVFLNITDSNGCTGQIILDMFSPCNNLIPGELFAINGTTFSVLPSGGSGTYTYEWSWEPAYWESGESDGNVLNLVPTSSHFPQVGTTISVTITDSNGCQVEASINHSICPPISNDLATVLICKGYTNTGNSVYSKRLYLNGESCTSQIDWKTVEFEMVPDGLVIDHPYSQGTSNEETRIDLYTENLETGNYSFKWRVKDINGFWSDYSLVSFIVPECNIGKGDDLCTTLNTIDCKCIKALCDSSELQIDLDDCIITPDECDCKDINEIDWSTFTIINGPYQTGASVTFNQSTHVLTYTVGANTGSDLIQWSVEDALGNHSGILSLTIVLECEESPVATDDVVCAYCNEAVIINVINNDTENGGSPIDPDSIMVIEPPQYGSFIVGPGTITYLPSNSFGNQDSLTYKISNYDGLESNVATVTIDNSLQFQITPGPVCTYTLKHEHPDDATNSWKHETVNNSTQSLSSIRMIIEEDCNGTVTEVSNEVVNFAFDWGTTQYSTGNSGINKIGSGGYIDYLRVHRDDGTGTITFLDVPLESSAVIAAGYNTGCAGTVNTSHLTFTPVGGVGDFQIAADFGIAVETVIKNAICAEWGLNEGTSYNLQVDTPLQGSVIKFTIAFDIMHNPTSDWVGIDITDPNLLYHINPTSTRSHVNVPPFADAEGGAGTYSNTVSCGLILAGNIGVTNTTNTLFNESLSTFNNIVPNTTGNTAFLFFESSGVLQGQCSDTLIEPVLCDITCDNPTYYWTGPNGFIANTETINTGVVGTYTLELTCVNINCVITNSVTI